LRDNSALDVRLRALKATSTKTEGKPKAVKKGKEKRRWREFSGHGYAITHTPHCSLTAWSLRRFSQGAVSTGETGQEQSATIAAALYFALANLGDARQGEGRQALSVVLPAAALSEQEAAPMLSLFPFSKAGFLLP